jgi:hemoglobin
MTTEAQGETGGDLDSEATIAELVRRFYGAVAQDDLLGPVFIDVARVDWPQHLTTLTAFWCRALLGQEGYAGNPFRQHRAVHERAPFGHAHFDRWLQLFDQTLAAWTGPHVERARALAREVARVHAHQLVDGGGLRVDRTERSG